MSCNKTSGTEGGGGGEDWDVVNLEKLGFRYGIGWCVHKTLLTIVWVAWENFMFLLARCLAGKGLVWHKKWAYEKNNTEGEPIGWIKCREKSIFHVRGIDVQTCIDLFYRHWDYRVKTPTKANKTLPHGLYYCRFTINLFFWREEVWEAFSVK